MTTNKVKKKLILASASKGRRQVLTRSGLAFDVIPSQIDEAQLQSDSHYLQLSEQALLLATKKAESVSRLHPDYIVIGGDQICGLDNTIFHKPGNRENAKAQLLQLSGQTHQLYTAVCLFENSQLIWSSVETVHMTMRSLTEEEIDQYLNLDSPFDACGAYYYESKGSALFDHVTGSKETIQGLPLSLLLEQLKELI